MQGTKPKTDRNAELFALYQHGVRPKVLVKKFRITRQRVHAIVRAQASLKRKATKERQKEGASASA